LARWTPLDVAVVRPLLVRLLVSLLVRWKWWLSSGLCSLCRVKLSLALDGRA
jgi:hypothetical protein